MIKENYRKYHILAKCGFQHFSVNNYTIFSQNTWNNGPNIEWHVSISSELIPHSAVVQNYKFNFFDFFFQNFIKNFLPIIKITKTEKFFLFLFSP